MDKKGFTLIELMIAIAIIGVLAAVLVPNLLSARRAAVDRAAQAYGHNVFKASIAYLSENINITSASITATCGANVIFTAGEYRVDPPGTSVQSCVITRPTSTAVAIEVTSQNGKTYSFQQ